MKKIVIAHLLNDYSGSPKVLSQVIEAVKEEGYQVELYTGRGSQGFLTGVADNQHTYFYKRYENKYLTLITFMLSQASLFFKLLKYRNDDVDIYVNTMLPFGAGLAGKLMGKRVFYHIHEISVEPAIFKRFLRYCIQKTATKTIFVSKSVEKSECFDGLDRSVVYNALSKDLFTAARENQYKWKIESKFNVLMICSLKKYKGVGEFIAIASLCEENQDLKFTLVLNASEQEIQTYFKHDVLPKNLKLITRQNNLIPFYQGASVLMNLSHPDAWVETFGLTILEAMAFGMPVIVPPVGGPIEIVTDGQEGYLISSYQTEKIAKRIISLSKNEKECMRLSKNARARSLCFNEAVFAEEILDLLGYT